MCSQILWGFCRAVSALAAGAAGDERQDEVTRLNSAEIFWGRQSLPSAPSPQEHPERPQLAGAGSGSGSIAASCPAAARPQTPCGCSSSGAGGARQGRGGAQTPAASVSYSNWHQKYPLGPPHAPSSQKFHGGFPRGTRTNSCQGTARVSSSSRWLRTGPEGTW